MTTTKQTDTGHFLQQRAPQDAPKAGPLVMESLGFGNSLQERIFFTGPDTSEEPAKVARIEARRAAACLLNLFLALGHEEEAHCERVASWSRRLARELGLSAERVLDVELGALLHNVGYLKLRRIDFARNGTGRLNAGEIVELHRHPQLGAMLLQEFPPLHRAIPLVAAHHERYDGSGYPHGWRGTEIVIEARIFHLVAAYAAITRERPHRIAVSDAEARAKLEGLVGTQLDPIVHAAFRGIDPADWANLALDLR
jgi:HD-GYP domain-containing protein (c-di-GMP phosphodiesterase class II)